MEKSSLRGYHKLSGSNSATSPPTSTAIDLIEGDEEFDSDRARKTLQIEDVDDANGWRSRRGCRDKIEGEGESVSLESSEEVDEHRLLSVSCSGGSIKSTGQSRYPQATRINLSQQQRQEEEDWNEEDIDPFSYCPPLTKWDKFKVSGTGSGPIDSDCIV